MYMVCHAILNNPTRLAKVKVLKGAVKQREKLHKYVIGECATQKRKLTLDEQYKAVAYIFARMDEALEKANDMVLTSQDGQYSVRYVNKGLGNYVDEWDISEEEV